MAATIDPSSDTLFLYIYYMPFFTCFIRYKDRALREPAGLALDFEDNIYVCDCKSNTIFQVTSDGARGRVVRSARVCVGSPVGIGFDQTGRRLWVTANIRRSGQLLTMFYLINWAYKITFIQNRHRKYYIHMIKVLNTWTLIVEFNLFINLLNLCFEWWLNVYYLLILALLKYLYVWNDMIILCSFFLILFFLFYGVRSWVGVPIFLVILMNFIVFLYVSSVTEWLYVYSIRVCI